MRKIELPRDTPTEFELGDTAAHIQWKREQREREEEAQKEREERQRDEAMREEIIQSPEEGVAEKIYLTDLDEEAILDFVKDHQEFYDKTNKHCGQGQEGMLVGKVCQQPQAICQSVQDLF